MWQPSDKIALSNIHVTTFWRWHELAAAEAVGSRDALLVQPVEVSCADIGHSHMGAKSPTAV